MVTAVCFDLDGTLVHPDRDYDAVLASTFDEHLGSAGDGLVDVYGEAFVSAFEARDPNPYRTAMAAVVERAGDDPDGVDLDAMVAAHREREYENATVPDAARDCLTELAADEETGLAVVTDGVGDWQREKLAHHDLTDHFDATVVSYDVGGHKADSEPYDAVRDRIDADEYVMVGDDYESDVEAARAAGFVPIHYEDDDGPEFFATLRAML